MGEYLAFFYGRVMRQFFNFILMQINEETLTDEEFNSLPEDLEQDYSEKNFRILKAILEERDTIDSSTRKLYGYFVAKGATFSFGASFGSSNIFVGAAL